MPIGNCAAISTVVLQLHQGRPRSVLDLGIGFGMYGAVVRQWLDLGIQPWQTHLTGVEVWSAYRNPVWDLYNVVFVETIQKFLTRELEPFDFIMLGDVIEHFERDEGVQLIGSIQRLVAPGGRFLIATPAVFSPQAAVHGNQWERHRSHWTANDFERLGFATLLSGDEAQIGFDPTILSVWQAI